jgi:hypothetical protein
MFNACKPKFITGSALQIDGGSTAGHWAKSFVRSKNALKLPVSVADQSPDSGRPITGYELPGLASAYTQDLFFSFGIQPFGIYTGPCIKLSNLLMSDEN